MRFRLTPFTDLSSSRTASHDNRTWQEKILKATGRIALALLEGLLLSQQAQDARLLVPRSGKTLSPYPAMRPS